MIGIEPLADRASSRAVCHGYAPVVAGASMPATMPGGPERDEDDRGEPGDGEDDLTHEARAISEMCAGVGVRHRGAVLERVERRARRNRSIGR